MPRYTYRCSAGHAFERQAGYEDATQECDCGAVASRDAVYRDQGVVFSGGGFTKSTLPPLTEPMAVQQEWFSEVKKAGWDGDRAKEELRKNRIEDKEGRKFVDTSKMPRST